MALTEVRGDVGTEAAGVGAVVEDATEPCLVAGQPAESALVTL
jgi:hypothetical protein